MRLSEGGVMPKEQINYEPTNTDAIEASLHWSSEAGGYAQIAFEFDVQMMRDYLAQLSRDSPTDSRTIYYTPELSRHELQTLIRGAKRARNAVYGADE
jgi:hypothetical protein